jgi:hypothetical protein
MTALLKKVDVPIGTPAWFMHEVETAQSEPRMHIVQLSPTLAKTILDLNPNNRSVRNTKVIQYASDMAAGKWALNGEPVIIAKDGKLNDGQHRCLAVIDSNATVPVMMLFGIDRDTRLTVDQGVVRGAADFLGMEGVANHALVAAIARMAIAYEHDHFTNLNFANYVTSTVIRERVAKDALLADAATFGHTNYHYSKRFAAASIIGFAYYVLTKINRDEARVFLERVCRGDGLKIGDPAHTLREKLLEGRMPRDRKIAMIFKAWNYHRRGMKVRANNLSSTLPFPALV